MLIEIDLSGVRVVWRGICRFLEGALAQKLDASWNISVTDFIWAANICIWEEGPGRAGWERHWAELHGEWMVQNAKTGMKSVPLVYVVAVLGMLDVVENFDMEMLHGSEVRSAVQNRSPVWLQSCEIQGMISNAQTNGQICRYFNSRDGCGCTFPCLA